MSRRTICCGDIHGCLTELKLLATLVDYRPGVDRWVCLGDLVDRGPDSPGVIRFAQENNMESVLGNHDSKLLRRAKHIQKERNVQGYRNPMRANADQENTLRKLSSGDMDWLAGLPLMLHLPEFNTVLAHAGCQPGLPLNKQPFDALTMIRYIHKDTLARMQLVMPGFKQPPDTVYWPERWTDATSVIFGHNVTSLEQIFFHENLGSGACFGIDTGCVFGGHLTALVLDDNFGDHAVWQVPAQRVYWEV